MRISDFAMFSMVRQKMDHLSFRQKVLAQNIANANTPNYLARDVQSIDYSKTAGAGGSPSAPRVRMALTSPGHIKPPLAPGDFRAIENKRDQFEISPNGNGVVLEDQIQKVSEAASDYRMMTQLYARNLDMLRIAVRRGQ